MRVTMDAQVHTRCEQLHEAIEALNDSQRSMDERHSEARERERTLLCAKIDHGHRDAETKVSVLAKEVQTCASQQSVDDTLSRCEKVESTVKRNAVESRVHASATKATLDSHTQELALLRMKVDAADERLTNCFASNDALMYELARSQSVARLASYDSDTHDGKAAAPGMMSMGSSRPARSKRGGGPAAAGSASPAPIRSSASLPSLPRP